MTSDVGLAVRSLGRQPALAAAVVGTLAVAIAANASLFAIFDGLLFKPLPYKGSDAIVRIEIPRGGGLTDEEFTSLRDGLATTPLLVEGTRVIPAGAFEEGTEVVIDWQLQPFDVPPMFFELFGVRPALGRPFAEVDTRTTDPAPAILGHTLWHRHFGADRDIVGRVIEIPGSVLNRRWLVAGVMPEGFEFPLGANFWTPSWTEPSATPVPDFARLAEGATIEALRRQFPRAVITPLREYMAPRGARAFGFLLGATGLLLLVAWIQIAALLFARATGRMREIGIRLGLGATRLRLVRQFAAEGCVVAGCALLVGWLAAPRLTATIVHWLPAEMTIGQSLAPDARTLWFVCMVSTAGAVLLSLLPAEIIRRASPGRLLRAGGTAGTPLDATRARTILLALQIAVTTMLVYVAGLAVHSFSAISATPLGFNLDGLVAVRLPVLTTVQAAPTPGEPLVVDQEHLRRQIGLQSQSLDAILATPGVLQAAGASRYPFQPGAVRLQTLTLRSDPERRGIQAERFNVTRGLPETLGVPIVDGRDFTDAEKPNRVGILTDDPTGSATALSSGQAVLVNESLARYLQVFGPAVGQVLLVGGSEYHVVGVLGDTTWSRPDAPPVPQLFVVSELTPIVLARVASNQSGAVALAIRTTLEQLWGNRASRQVIRLEGELARTTADYRARSMLLALLALICLPLAAAGLVGAQMDLVRQRSREIAIRLALGADAGIVRRHLMVRAMAPVAIGLAAGLGGGAIVGRLMSTYLFGVTAVDSASAGVVVAGLLIISWLAAFWPANRAAHLDPAVALRAE